MTLQASGSMTIADINTELGRSAGASLSTDDTELLEMAWLTSSDPITIPDDLYGKAHLGTFREEIEVTPQLLFSSTYGFNTSNGSVSPTAYRGYDIFTVYNYESGAAADYVVTVFGTAPTSLITSIRVLEDGIFYESPSSSGSGSGVTTWIFGDGTNSGLWTASDAGGTKTIRIYGD